MEPPRGAGVRDGWIAPREPGTMTTLRQRLANWRNAQRSTGPKTPEGIAASSQNAVSHGFTATQGVNEDEQSLIASRRDEWLADLKPKGTRQRWFADQAIACSARIDRCRLHLDAWQ